MVHYVIGDVEKELETVPDNYVERRLVLCAQDEMTVQANDDEGKTWVLENQYKLKKGVGRGIHRSDMICSMVGHVVDGSESLEYGKSYEGYLDGEKFVKQVREAGKKMNVFLFVHS
jgi:hypothetical protein